MKDLQNKTKKDNVHSHIDSAFEIINDNLPVSYVDKVKAFLPKEVKQVITDQMIRNVRHKRQNPENQPEIFTALLKVAKKHLAFKKSLAAEIK